MAILATPGDDFGDWYEVERELDPGGMAHVYVARDLRYGRRVAIKVLRPELADAMGGDRFLREIEVVARLQHPHILPLFDSGVAHGLPFYVMPLVEGETLRERLRREVQLPIPDALRIAAQVADALDYAHSLGVIHRDIKPGNILLSGDRAFVADFGIARLAEAAVGEWRSPTDTTIWRTETGLVVGTVGYMSPEQATGAPQQDGRSDQYGLASVVHEMLAGETPFHGPTLQVWISKVLTLPPPSVRIARESVPGLMDAALRRALARTPADRFRMCGEFVAALSRQPTWWDRLLDLARTRAAKRAYAVGGLSTAAIVIAVVASGGPGGGALAADTTRYVIFPFEREGGTMASLAEARLDDAFGRWTGITVVPGRQVREALGRDSAPRSEAQAQRVARKLGAGRYVRVSVVPIGDSVRLQASLYDAGRRGPALQGYSVRLSQDLTGADATLATVADQLLFSGFPPDGTPGAATTRSFSAARAFADGERALQVWDLSEADSAFSRATRADAVYAQAHLWQALARAWSGAEPERWRLAAEQAAVGRERLSPKDLAMADAALSQARGDLGPACARWRQVTSGWSRDYEGWFGWARCQATDSAVVRDRGSPSDWSFRSSYHRLLLAYERAFELHPVILNVYQAGGHDPLQRLLFIRGNAWRWGRALPPDTVSFRADPAWMGDTLAFVPYPVQAITSQQYTAPTAALDEAIRQQRLRFRRIAETWTGAFPASPGALEALSTSLAMISDPAAIDTLRHARAMARDSDERLRLAGVEVWMDVAFGVPGGAPHLRRARALADSLLREHPPRSVADPLLLAGLAALTGRAHTAAEYMRDPRAGEALYVQPLLRPTAQVLLTYAALGGPRDSLVALERMLRSTIGGLTSQLERDEAIDAWLVRAATLAFATQRFESLSELAGRDNYLLGFQLLWTAGDTSGVRRALLEHRESRLPMSPELMTLDGLYPEAELLAALGDWRASAAWLDPTLGLLPRKTPRELAHPVRAASLVRALALRARVDQRLGDPPGAARWAAAVVILWSDADPFLQPLVSELRRLAE